jgi:hypothetical protein
VLGLPRALFDSKGAEGSNATSDDVLHRFWRGEDFYDVLGGAALVHRRSRLGILRRRSAHGLLVNMSFSEDDGYVGAAGGVNHGNQLSRVCNQSSLPVGKSHSSHILKPQTDITPGRLHVTRKLWPQALMEAKPP